jgi:hypothetical protein
MGKITLNYVLVPSREEVTMKKEHFVYLEDLLTKEAIDEETIETYTGSAWQRFIEKHLVTTRLLLEVTFREDTPYLLDEKVEKHFLGTIRQLLDRKLIAKDKISGNLLFNYLLAIAQLKMENHGRIILLGLKLAFIIKATIPTELLFAALFYACCRERARKCLRIRMEKPDFERLTVLIQAPPIYEVNRRLEGSIRSRGKERLPDHLIPRNLIN